MKIKTLKVKGFRGFIKEREFDFAPVTIIFGSNGTGKSSTLNAIEWCLWGKECVGKETGIRERIDWEIKNRNVTENPFVEIEFDNREKIAREYISDRRDEPRMAETINSLLKKYSFNDFFVGVYQHQEVIRAILNQEPRNRNEGFDRLFGLSDYRNFIKALNEAKDLVDNLYKEADTEASEYKNKIKGKIEVWETGIEKLKQELKNKGIEEFEFTKEKEVSYKEKLLKDLKEFIENLSLKPSDEFNQMRSDEKTEQFVKVMKNEITKLRSEMPDVKKQNELFQRQGKLKKLLEEYKEYKGALKGKKEESKNFMEKNGSRNEIDNRINELNDGVSKIEKEKEQKSLQGSTIEKAIEYLKKEGIDKNICPVCGKETTNLLEHLKEEWEEKYRQKLEELNKQLEFFQSERKNKAELIKKLEEMERDIKRTDENLKGKIKSIQEELKREIKEDEDPEAILNKELEGIEENLEKLKNAVEQKQNTLNSFEEELAIVYKLMEYLEKIELRERARGVEKTEEWKKMNKRKEELIKLKERTESIISAIKMASQEEAKTKVENAGERINKYFAKITKHPQIENLKLEVKEDKKTGGNNYEIKDDSNKSIIAVLSQGNMNALALSIFLALCENMPFEFIMLDDPSQSLSSDEKKNFVEILDSITEKNKSLLLLWTMSSLSISKISRKKRKSINLKNGSHKMVLM